MSGSWIALQADQWPSWVGCGRTIRAERTLAPELSFRYRPSSASEPETTKLPDGSTGSNEIAHGLSRACETPGDVPKGRLQPAPVPDRTTTPKASATSPYRPYPSRPRCRC